MALEIPPTPVGRRRSLAPGIAVVAAGTLMVVIAVATGSSRPPAASSAPPTARVAAATSAVPDAPRVALAPRLPDAGVIDCHGLGTVACGQVARAAVDALPGDVPPITGIGVWATILCNDDLDCPRGRLLGYRPLGSAIVAFGAYEPRAWVNVLEPAPYPGRVWEPTATVAWVIRWQP